MKKQKANNHLRIIEILAVSIVVLALYSGFLTYQIYANRAASESVDKSLAESIYKQLSAKTGHQD